MAKISKKATAKIIELVQSIDKSIGKNISFVEAWGIIAEYVGVEGSITTDVHNSTIFEIYKDDQVIGSLSWDNAFDPLQGTWDWTLMYKDVIEYMMSHKLVKKPRTSKKVVVVPTKVDKQSTKVDNDLDTLKRRKNTLYRKIRNIRLKTPTADVSGLVKEYDEICSKLK